MNKMAERKIGEKGEVLSFIHFNKCRCRKWMSALVALVFLFTVCSPGYARIGNYGDSETSDNFYSGVFSAVLSAIMVYAGGANEGTGSWTAVASAAAYNIAGVYSYYHAYEEYGETYKLFGIWELACDDCLGIEGFDIDISRGEFVAITASVIAGMVAGMISSSVAAKQAVASTVSSAAGEAAAEQALAELSKSVAEFVMGDILYSFLTNWASALLQQALTEGFTSWFRSEAFGELIGLEEGETLDKTLATILGQMAGSYTGGMARSAIQRAVGLMFGGKFYMTREGKVVTAKQKALLDAITNSGKVEVKNATAMKKGKDGTLKEINRTITVKDMAQAAFNSKTGNYELKDGTVIVIKGGSAGFLSAVNSYKAQVVTATPILKAFGDVARGRDGVALQDKSILGGMAGTIRHMGWKPLINALAQVAYLKATGFDTYTRRGRERRRDQAQQLAMARDRKSVV